MNQSLSLEAVEPPKVVREFQPEWGIVLGSGLGALVDEVDAILALPYDEIPGLPVSTVTGHAGRFVLGKLGGVKVIVAQGRVHLYEGRTAEEVTAGVRFMGAVGVKRLVLTNAAGTVNAAHPPGGWMMLSDHLNLTGTTPLLGGANFIDMSEVYSKALRTRFRELAVEEKIVLHEGVYAGLLGPQYETPAEIRMLQRLGADAVGMSTVLEAIQFVTPSMSLPQGIGWAQITVGKTGALKITGRMGDSAKFSAAATVHYDGTWTFYAPHPTQPGAIVGTMSFDRAAADSDTAGTLTWNNPGGFGTTQVTCKAALFKAVKDTQVLRFTNPTTGVATFDIAGAGQTLGPFALNVDNKNVVTVTNSGAEELGVKLSASKGTMTGSFIGSGDTKASFTGVVQQKLNRAAGVFEGFPTAGSVLLTPQ